MLKFQKDGKCIFIKIKVRYMFFLEAPLLKKKKDGWQVKSKVAVKPVKKIEVNLSDF